MNRRVLVAAFSHEEDVVAAVRAVRRLGLAIVDVWGPYPVHGLERAMGLRRSRLPLVSLILGLVGAALKIYFEYWTTWISWPLNVGGKPWDSLPAFVPVTFEVMVLSAGLSTLVAFFIAVGLWPGKRPETPDPRATDDRFVMVLEETDAAFDVEEIGRLLERHGGFDLEERIVPPGRIA